MEERTKLGETEEDFPPDPSFARSAGFMMCV
jgi:hypothetical protein